jgi:hypothetical protein
MLPAAHRARGLATLRSGPWRRTRGTGIRTIGSSTGSHSSIPAGLEAQAGTGSLALFIHFDFSLVQ